MTLAPRPDFYANRQDDQARGGLAVPRRAAISRAAIETYFTF